MRLHVRCWCAAVRPGGAARRDLVPGRSAGEGAQAVQARRRIPRQNHPPRWRPCACGGRSAPALETTNGDKAHARRARSGTFKAPPPESADASHDDEDACRDGRLPDAQVTKPSRKSDRGGGLRGDGSSYQGRRSGNASANAAKAVTRTTATTREMTTRRSPSVIPSLGSDFATSHSWRLS
jgi:hypothetical protein